MMVSDVMTKKVVTIGMDDSLERINSIFNKRKFHHVLVMEGEELVGIISDRDVLKQISPFINTLSEHSRDLNTLKTKAHQMMTRKPVVIVEDYGLKQAADVFLSKKVSCLPVVSQYGTVVGILSWKDILKSMAQKEEM